MLAEQEGEFDSDTRWALAWFDEAGFAEGEYGRAEQLSVSMNLSVAGLSEAGILLSGQGKVRLLRPNDLPKDWDPSTDIRTPVWECVHHLVRSLETGGEGAAATLVSKLGAGRTEAARELAYHLYSICERRKRAADALSYNSLIQSWSEIESLSKRDTPAQQGSLI